jgi:Bifunctional DNA primase/polymerase, N-terminal
LHQTFSPLEAALAYHRAGLRVFPVPHRSKKCVVPGWSSSRFDKAELRQLFNPRTLTNIGLLNGAPSGGLVDVDLDTLESVAAADLLLPFTCTISGRAGSRRSHRFYKCENPPPTATFRGVDGKMLVELRSTGTMTVVPPSVHPSGELVEWQSNAGDATRLQAEELSRLVALVAAATLFALHWPAEGSRHDAALALAGGLLRVGWAEADAEAFVMAVAVAANDEEARSRVRDVISTAARIEAGASATGWPFLARLLRSDGDELVRLARNWLGINASVEVADGGAPNAAWPNPPGDEAFYGLAGEFVNILDPATEVDRVAVLVQTLIGFGNLIGRTAHFVVESDKHYANEFAVLVGRTSKARKGTSSGRVRAFLRPADEVWADTREVSGLSSGEGVIWAVRDAIQRQDVVKDGEEERSQTVVVDPGATDKRLLVSEPEFAGVLRQTERHGNTLSVHVRQAWDSGRLQSMTKNSPVIATGAHVSIIGHITVEELCRYLTATEVANGFGNRFTYFAVQRSKLLAEGGQPDKIALAQLGDRLWAAAELPAGWARCAATRRPASCGPLCTGRCRQTGPVWPGLCSPGPKRT